MRSKQRTGTSYFFVSLVAFSACIIESAVGASVGGIVWPGVEYAVFLDFFTEPALWVCP